MKKKITVAELAKLVGGEVRGEGRVELSGAASLENAGPGEVSFVAGPKFKAAALASKAGALIVKTALGVAAPQVIVADPYSAFVQAVSWFHPEERPAAGVHPSAVVEAEVELGEGVHVGALAAIGRGARIGAGSVIGAGVVIGAGAEVGADSTLHARVTLYPGVKIGSRVIIHSGTVIGSEGFGYILSAKGHVKKPQVGGVIVEDDVEIGANCAIDRAMLDNTVIGQGTKLDNLVHIAHGVRIGKHCILLAAAAVGGSSRIGDFAIISGNATVKDNLVIGDHAIVIGHSAVAADVAPGQTVWGLPAIPFSLAKRVYARLKQLPELFSRVRALEKIIKEKEK